MMAVKMDKVASVSIIGRSGEEEFAPLLAFLRLHPAVRITGEDERISEALDAGLGLTRPTDIAILLQSCSDEYSTEEANQLIGRMLFGRILCCYGPWCLADGRSHNIWPVSTRVPVASAEMLLAMELAAFAAGEPPLSPMSAGEEVFVHRISQSQFCVDHRESTIFIISSEPALRKTIEGIVTDAGHAMQQMPATVDAVRTAISKAVVAPRMAILDLDPPDTTVEEILAALYKAIPDLTVLGLTVFPQASFLIGPLHAIIDKTELLLQLQRQFHRQEWVRNSGSE